MPSFESVDAITLVQVRTRVDALEKRDEETRDALGRIEGKIDGVKNVALVMLIGWVVALIGVVFALATKH
jgi:hypothetical protein